MTMKLFAITVVSTLALSACSTNSRLVTEREDGGRLVYMGEPDSFAGKKGLADAEKKMAAKCPNGYTIKEKGEQQGSVTVGSPLMNQKLPEKYIDFVCKPKA
jgi:hypothetical protein